MICTPNRVERREKPEKGLFFFSFFSIDSDLNCDATSRWSD